MEYASYFKEVTKCTKHAHCFALWQAFSMCHACTLHTGNATLLNNSQSHD